jgi:hypothetical protein
VQQGIPWEDHEVRKIIAERDALKEAIKKIVVFNVNDVRRPMLSYDEEAVQTIWGILGFPVAQKKR